MTFTIQDHTITCDACHASHTNRFPEERARWRKDHPKTCTAVRR